MSNNTLKQMAAEFGEVTEENLAKARKAGPENNLTLPPLPEPNTNRILFDSLSKSYDKLNKIYKEFNKIYIRVPSGNAEKKERYATLLRLKTEFDNEYTTINESLRYSGNDRGVRNLIKDITKLRGELLLITRSIRRHDIGLTYTMGNAYKQFIKKYDTLKQLINTDPNQNIETIKTYYETTIEPIKRTFESEFNRLDPKNVSPATYHNVEEKKAIVNRMSAELRSRINGIERERVSTPEVANDTDPRIVEWRRKAEMYKKFIERMKEMNTNTQLPASSAFAAAPAPIPASPTSRKLTNATRRAKGVQLAPVGPPKVPPSSSTTRNPPTNPFANNALKPNARPVIKQGRTVENSKAIHITNAPEEQSASLYSNMNRFEKQPAPPAPIKAPPRWAQPGRPPVPSATPPDPVRAPPRQWPPPGPIRLPGRNTRKNAPLPKRQLKVAPPPPLPQVSSRLQTQNTRKNSNVFNNLANNRQRARDLIRTSILGKQPVMTKMYQNTRRNGNRNALNMSTLEEQSVPVQQSQKPNNNSLSGNSLQTLGMIERGIGVSSQTPAILPNPEQSDKKLFKNIHETATQFETAVSGKPVTPQQPVQYIKLAKGTTYKFIEMIGDKVKAQKLDRSTKTWEPVVELTVEDLMDSTEVRCPSSPQSGGRRTIRRRIVKPRKHKTLRRKSGK